MAATGRLLVMAFSCLLFLTVALHQRLSPVLSQYATADENGIPRDNNEDERIDTTIPKAQDTLAHFDPYFMGGFRNQHMRFVAFVAFAVKNNIPQILLPSLRWVDPYNKPNSIEHEFLFDVHYWNARAANVGLPILVNYDPRVLEGMIVTSKTNNGTKNETPPELIPCWDTAANLFSGLAAHHLRGKHTNLRRMNTWNLMGQEERNSHCRRTMGDNANNNPDKIREEARQNNNATKTVYRFTHLIPHGGLISSGRLWWEYVGLQDGRGSASETMAINNGQDVVQIHPEHVAVEKAVYEILRPSKYLREAGENAIREAMQNTTVEYALEGGRPPRVLALHPRVEQEMLTHKCSKFMESNLAKVFERIQTYPPFTDDVNNINSGYRFDLVFIAISKMEVEKEVHHSGQLGMTMNQNREALQRARLHGLFGSITSGKNNISVPIFESGTESAARIKFPRVRMTNNATEEEVYFATPQDLGVMELVASIINFFTVVNADIFVGVRGSTYSTDAFSVRYYQHKEEGGGENHIVNRDGIERLYGPAPPHACV